MRAVGKELLLDECQNVRDHVRPAKLAAVVHREQVRQEERPNGGDLAPRVQGALVHRDEKGVLDARVLQRACFRSGWAPYEDHGAAGLQALLHAPGLHLEIHFCRPPQPYDFGIDGVKAA